MSEPRTKQQFTPGPWRADVNIRFTYGRNPDALAYVRWAENGYAICIFPNTFDDETQNANARLIAASPTMAAYIGKRASEGDPEATAIMEAIHGA